MLKAELDAYLPGLSDRPAIVVGTKTDLLNTSAAAAALLRKTDLPVVTLSAKEAKGSKIFWRRRRGSYKISRKRQVMRV